MTEPDYRKAEEEGASYRTGLVVKVTGDDDPDLKEWHNTWAVITQIVDPYHFKVVDASGSGEDKVIRDEDVKAWIGDLKHDYRGLGEKRHEEEVKPLIEKAMKGKIPVVYSEADEEPPRGGYVGYYRRIARTTKGKDVSGENVKNAEAAYRDVVAKKDKYDPADYPKALKIAQDYLQGAIEARREVLKYGLGETVRRGWE